MRGDALVECRNIGRRAIALVAGAGVVTLMASAALAGTTGKLAGRVLDQKKQPLPGATISIPLLRLGAAADADGRYSILNIPAGKYAVRISLIGYRATTVTEVSVSSDLTTKLDAVLEEAPLEMQEVVVTAERPVVDVSLTSNVQNVSRDVIQSLPVQDLQDVVNLQAGVVEGHFRGGRVGEVQYQVDGVTVNNVFNNQSSLKLDRSLLEEVQVISGTFDAEYGQAMSGVVNAVLRRGTEKFAWDAEALVGGFVYPNDQTRPVGFAFQPSDIQNYQLSLSGPTGLPKTVFLLSGRRSWADGFVRAIRRFQPQDSLVPTGDGASVPLGYAHGWSGVGKVSNRSLPGVELSYQMILESSLARKPTWSFRFNPDGLSHQEQLSHVHGLDWTHTLSKSTFYTLNVRKNNLDYQDMAYDDVYDPRYDESGPPTGYPGYEDGAFIQGVEFTRFVQKTNTLVLKGSMVSQFTRDQQAKLGAEFQWPKLQFGSPGYLTYATVGGVSQLVRHVNEPPNYPPVSVYEPVQGAVFAQDQLEWNDLTVRAGVRMDYFQANSSVPDDLANPANSISGAPQSNPVATSTKMSFSPRLGISYPVGKKAALFFAYGHFYQMPALGEIFTNADYGILSDLQAGGISYGVLGNPDIKPEMTVQYQIGYKHALTEDLGLDMTVFYKDIRDLLGVEFVTTYNGAEYARLTNVDFGNVIGMTVSLDQRRVGPFSSTLDYTWQVAEGNSSDPRETATRASAGEDPRPRQIPFNWDQRHTLNLTALLSRPESYALSAIVRLVSGQPYTPELSGSVAGFGSGLETNSGRKPNSLVVDLRGERNLGVRTLPFSLFARIFNLFDAEFNNGFVFSSTGSALYSRSPADRAALGDPTLLYSPRRIEVGVTLNRTR